jgi:ankyrin repeat protein
MLLKEIKLVENFINNKNNNNNFQYLRNLNKNVIKHYNDIYYSEYGIITLFIDYNNLIATQELLRNPNINLNGKDSYNRTLLHNSAETDNIIIASYLLNLDYIDVNSIDYEGQTPLIISLLNRNIDIFKLLLKRKDINIYVEDNYNCSVISYTNKMANKEEILSILNDKMNNIL